MEQVKYTSRRLGWMLLGLGASALVMMASAVRADDNLKINGFLTAGVTTMDGKSPPPCPENRSIQVGSTVVGGLMNVNPGCSVVSRTSVNPSGMEFTPYYDHITSQPSWTIPSLLGLQANYTIDPKSSLTAQLVAYGAENYRVQDVWTYGTYNVNEDLSVRVGRQRIPFYMLSEVLDVGLAYPWARPPLDLYSVQEDSYNGISSQWKWQKGDWSGGITALFGSLSNNANDTPYFPVGLSAKNLRGIKFDAYWGNLTLFASYNVEQLHLNVQDDQSPGQKYYNLNRLLLAVGQPGITDETAGYEDVGLTYDNGSLLVMSEIGDQFYSQGILQDQFRGYVLVGYHLGAFLPSFTISKSRTNTAGNSRRSQAISAIADPNNLSKIAALAGSNPTASQLTTAINSSYYAQEGIANDGMEETTYTTSLRYDITPRVSAKVEWSRLQGFGSGFGGLGGGLNTSGWGMFSDAPVGGKVNVYTFVVNAAF